MSKSFDEIKQRAVEISDMYDELNLAQNRAEWDESDVMAGFVGDVGDLSKLVMAKKGTRTIADTDTKVAHELADCLWSLAVLANKLDVDLEASFLNTMNELEERIEGEMR